MHDTSKFTYQKVIKSHFWVPGKLFSLYVTRYKDYHFLSGQFARISIPSQSQNYNLRNIWRAYSIVTGPKQPYLEFYVVIIPGGILSQNLSKLKPNDELCIDNKAYGFLTIDQFTNGGDLWLIASGTGLSAYISILRDARTWSSFKKIILIHGVRKCEELTYSKDIKKFDEMNQKNSCKKRFQYLPLVTRETIPGIPKARITTLLENGKLEMMLDRNLDPSLSKVMLCGNPQMLTETRKLLRLRGFYPGRRGAYGNIAMEKYW